MKVLVLAGGLSPERNVSLSSGAMVCEALRKRGHQVALMDLFYGLDGAVSGRGLYVAPIPESYKKVDREAPDLEAVRARRGDDDPSAIGPGIFEMCHHLLEIQNCLMNFYEYPDEMHELIECLTNWELRYAEQICTYLKPDALFHHDDWGSQISTFISPDMFREFIKPAY